MARRRRILRISAVTVSGTVAAAALVIAVGMVAPPTRAADIYGDDQADRYVGTGGLVLPGTVGSATRAEVAGCPGCQWRLSSPCLMSDSGNPFSGTPTCLSVVRGCPDVAQLLRAWFRPPSGPWREIGLVCIDEDGPVTVETLGIRVRDRLERAVPRQRPAYQPARGVVTQLPVVFDSGQSGGALRETFDLTGEQVLLEAVPSWRWEFGDGAALVTDDPGGGYPNMAVAHVYRATGDYRVSVETRWTAQFTVDGLGPFPVADPVRQTATLRVSIGEGRAVLATR